MIRQLLSRLNPFRSATVKAVDQQQVKREKLLKRLNSQKYVWRSMASLMRAIGTQDRDYARGLLVEVGARPSYRDDSLWALKSRVGETGRRRRGY